MSGTGRIRLFEADNNSEEDADNSEEDEDGRVSLVKKELEVVVTRIVHKEILKFTNQHFVPLISRIVKQEVELGIQKLLASSKQNLEGGILHSPESRSFLLKFLNKLSLPVYTGRKIEGEGHALIMVALVDGITGQVVKCGSEASAEVEIVVVEGDFDDKRSNWTAEEFNNKTVRGTEGRKFLLIGNVRLNLKEGIGSVGEISFTHNSNWMKICEYRLGAKVVQNLSGNRVREAVTESFVVKDRRITWRGKHHPPSQCDEVWRLVEIGKGGPRHQSLEGKNIKTVKDFLTQYYKNPQWLHDILGTGMPAKTWEAIVDHARTCILDKRLHLYFPVSSQKNSGVVFNDVGQVMGLLSECSFKPIEMLSEAEKADTHKWVLSAFEHKEKVMHFDDEASMHSYLLSNSTSYPSNSPWLGSSGNCCIEASHTDYGYDHTQPSTSFHNNADSFLLPTSHFNDGFIQPSTDTPGTSSFIPSFGNTVDPFDIQSDLLNELLLTSPGNFVDHLNCYARCEDEHYTDHSLHYQNSIRDSQGDLNSMAHGFMAAQEAAEIIAKARRRWTLLYSVLRILRWFSVRKIATLKPVSSEAVIAPKRPRIY